MCVDVWACPFPAGFGRSLGAVSWHIRVFPRLAPRPVPRIIMVLLRVCVCVYFTITFSSSLLCPHIPALHCVWSQWCHLSVLCVCVSVHTQSFRGGEYIMQMRERARTSKKAECGSERMGVQGREAEWKWVCARAPASVCVSVCPRAAKSAINLTPSWQHECVVVWHCVSVCVWELESDWYHQFLYWNSTVELEPSMWDLVNRGGKLNNTGSTMSYFCKCDAPGESFLYKNLSYWHQNIPE